MRFAATALIAFCACISPIPDAEAKEGDFGFSLGTASGYVAGMVPDMPSGGSFQERNPFLMDLQIDYEILGWLGVGLRNELGVEKGTTYTLVPNLIFDSNGDVVTGYGRIGPLINFTPDFYGAAVGGGIIIHAHRHFGFYLEASCESMFIGSGLTGKGAIIKGLGYGGLRLNI